MNLSILESDTNKMISKYFLNPDKIPYKNIRWLIEGLFKIIDGLVMIFTFGFYYSSLSMSFVEWSVRKRFKYMKLKQK